MFPPRSPIPVQKLESLEPTPGIEPGTPSLRETPGANSGEQPRLLATIDPLQMKLFDLDPEEQP